MTTYVDESDDGDGGGGTRAALPNIALPGDATEFDWYAARLNPKQLEAVKYVRELVDDGRQALMWVEGGPGTGKSYILLALTALYGKRVQCTAFTGVAAVV